MYGGNESERVDERDVEPDDAAAHPKVVRLDTGKRKDHALIRAEACDAAETLLAAGLVRRDFALEGAAASGHRHRGGGGSGFTGCEGQERDRTE